MIVCRIIIPSLPGCSHFSTVCDACRDRGIVATRIRRVCPRWEGWDRPSCVTNLLLHAPFWQLSRSIIHVHRCDDIWCHGFYIHLRPGCIHEASQHNHTDIRNNISGWNPLLHVGYSLCSKWTLILASVRVLFVVNLVNVLLLSVRFIFMNYYPFSSISPLDMASLLQYVSILQHKGTDLKMTLFFSRQT